MAIDPILLTAARIECFKNGESLAHASGFFYEVGRGVYLVTNRHVVIDEEEEFFPDELRILLHTSPTDMRQNRIHCVPLYRFGSPVWLEHPSFDRNVDVVAILIDPQSLQARYVVQPLGMHSHLADGASVCLGQDLIVLGYPLGIYDRTHNLPIARNATVASAFGVPFRGEPHFLVDSRLHFGSSGSAVLTKPSQVADFDGNFSVMSNKVSFLVGVFSASLDTDDRDPDEDEPLDLNYVWFAELIPQIIWA